MKEITSFITDADLQAAGLALKLASATAVLNPQAEEVQHLISRACFLAKSPLIQGASL
jgi:hypothetical protein